MVERAYCKIEKKKFGTLFRYCGKQDISPGDKAVVDHKALLPLYNKVTRPKQARVNRHRIKLAAFDFEVVYKPGTSKPCDYKSRHPPTTAEGQDEAARQEQWEQDDTKVYVSRLIHN